MPWLQIAGSAAIDTVDDRTCPPPFTDQRGIKRLQDGNGGVGPASDTGSYKLIGGTQPAPPTTATCHGLATTNAGTAAGEIAMGAASRPAIQCLAGNDAIGSLQGNGVLCGGMGDDTIYGGLGND